MLVVQKVGRAWYIYVISSESELALFPGPFEKSETGLGMRLKGSMTQYFESLVNV